MLKKMVVGLFLSLGTVSSGCAGEADGAFSLEEVDTVAENLLALSQNLGIPARHKNTVEVNVCWVMTQAEFDSYAAVRGWVQEAIENSWQQAAWIRYSDWNRRCTSSDPARRLYLDPDMSSPGSTGGGAIKLNPDFTRPGLTNKESVMMTAVHEFGHALAFNHPHHRYDWTRCPNGAVAKDVREGVVTGTVAEDQWSIVSYCIPERIENFRSTGNFLSPYDIRDVKKFYGGDAHHVRFGSKYALRNQNKKYAEIVDGWYLGLTNKFGSQDEYLKTFRFEPAPGSDHKQQGSKVQYGDFVRVIDPGSGLPVCHSSWGLILSNSNETGMNAYCRWQVARTKSGVGGNNVDVNDPFRLRFAPLNGSLGSYFSLADETNWRVLGPF